MADDRSGGDDKFLARWSRRKNVDRDASRAQRRRDGATPADDGVLATRDVTTAPPAVTPEAKLLATQETDQEAALRDLPPVDELNKDSDFTQFLKDGVPEALKRQALRRLWALDPQFGVADPFTEYGGDYTVVIPIDPIKDTIHRAGLGYLTPEEMAKQRGDAKKKVQTDEKDADRPAENEPAETADSGAAPAGAEAAAGDQSSGRPEGADDDDQAPSADAHGAQGSPGRKD